MIKCACHTIDRARGDLYVVGKNEWTATSTLAKFGGGLFEGVGASGAVSDLYRSTEDGHVPSVSHPTTVKTR